MIQLKCACKKVIRVKDQAAGKKSTKSAKATKKKATPKRTTVGGRPVSAATKKSKAFRVITFRLQRQRSRPQPDMNEKSLS